MIVGTWFVKDDYRGGTYFPQIKKNTGDLGVADIYLRCVLVLFATARLNAPHSTLVFWTNILENELPSFFSDALAIYSVEIRTINERHGLSSSNVLSWGNQFFVFDVLKDYAQDTKLYLDGNLLLLDSDCVIVDSLLAVDEAIDAYGALHYTLDHRHYPEDVAINGLTRRELASFCRTQLGCEFERIEYAGGELVGVTHRAAGEITMEFNELWPAITSGVKCAPREEAHTLSVIMAKYGYQTHTANQFIKRIWTGLKYKNGVADDMSLKIWHLPAEKRTGFSRLHKDLSNWRRWDKVYLGRVLGVPRPSFVKTFVDLIQSAFRLR